MARITGNEAKVILKKSTVWGTAVAAGAADLIALDSFDASTNVDQLESNQLGLGLGMKSDIGMGNTTVEATLEMAVGWENKADVILASFFGDPQTPVEQTIGEGDYLHVLRADTSLHQNGFLTIAEKVTDSATIEYPSVAVSSITLSHEEPTSDLILSCDLMCSKEELATSVNTLAVVNAATLAPQSKIKVLRSSRWMINEQSDGALTAPTHVLPVTSASVTLTRGMQILNEVSNLSYSPQPSSEGFLEGTLELNLTGLSDLTYYTGFQSETFYKVSFYVEGAQIESGDPRSFELVLPSVKINTVDRSLSEAGDNAVTLSFDIFSALTLPTGCTSLRPYINLVNTRSTSY